MKLIKLTNICFSLSDDGSSIGTSTSDVKENVYVPNKDDDQIQENMPSPKNTDWFSFDDTYDDNDPNSWGY